MEVESVAGYNVQYVRDVVFNSSLLAETNVPRPLLDLHIARHLERYVHDRYLKFSGSYHLFITERENVFDRRQRQKCGTLLVVNRLLTNAKTILGKNLIYERAIPNGSLKNAKCRSKRLSSGWKTKCD
ncbi:hypothetical protein Syun_020790 [Stephania yunnanensis]|uniref:Uncharacterized protein n=1 Tax=Stephania yunnanensis TaxID=152371 RepID=A0AAP0NP75_9MAGN